MNPQKITPCRDPRIEWIKIIAIYCVVFQHMVHANSLNSIKTLTHGAVPAFAFLSVYFAANSGLKPNLSWRWLQSRCTRLYGLFIIWNTIYFTTRMVGSHSGAPTTFQGLSFDSFFLSGYDNALWFVPYVLIANSLAFSIARLSISLGENCTKTLAVSTGVAALALAAWHDFASIKPCIILLDLSRKAIPASLAALSISLFVRNKNKYPVDWRSARLFVGLIFLGSCCWLLCNQRAFFLPESALGLSAIALGLSLIPRQLPAPEPDFALFIFVSHSMFVHVTRKLLFLAGLNWDASSAVIHLAGYILLLMVMALVYQIIRHTLIGDLLLARVSFNRIPIPLIRKPGS